MNNINKYESNDRSCINKLSYIAIKDIQLKEVSREEFNNFVSEYPTSLEAVMLSENNQRTIIYTFFDPKLLSYNSFDSDTSEIRCQMVAQVTECLCCNNKRYEIWEKPIDEIYKLFMRANVAGNWR